VDAVVKSSVEFCAAKQIDKVVYKILERIHRTIPVNAWMTVKIFNNFDRGDISGLVLNWK